MVANDLAKTPKENDSSGFKIVCHRKVLFQTFVGPIGD